MVTMATQDLSEFALHARAVTGLPVPGGDIPLRTPGASCVVLADSQMRSPVLEGLAAALASGPNLDARVFGKPDARPGRRMAVVLATAQDAESARDSARAAAQLVSVRDAGG